MNPRLVRVINRPQVIDREADDEFEVVGDDNRAAVIDTTRAPYRFICNLDIRFQSTDRTVDARGDGTGTLISGRHVLTCAHNIRKVDKGKVLEAQTITIAPGKSTRLPVFQWNPFGSTVAVKGNYHVPARWLDVKTKKSDTNFDYALITLKEDIATTTYKRIGDKKLGYWGSRTEGGNTRVKALAPGVLANKAVFCAGYPTDKCGSKDSTKGCLPGRQQGTQYVALGSVLDAAPAPYPGELWHNVDTKGGQSGGPVWRVEPADGGLYLIAIHTGSRTDLRWPAAINRGVRITEPVLKDLRAWGWNG